MASLDKLAIRGIRSFDDKSTNIIQFYTPLTVIVGTNGSGKTTIIECLKYATTGDLPPNSKGGAFVHDPGMATANEIKAQVRLRFFNTNHVRINCVRNLQVTRKKGGGLTMKTLEALLSIEDPNVTKNRRSVLSTKCAEVDTEVPASLGVSRAILDNVIFCHQEDNNWPLGDGASLKKRFDDIFEATRYTKALVNIKSLRKERAIALKVGKAELDGLKTDRQRANTVKDKMAKTKAELAGKEKKSEELNGEIDQLITANKSLYDKATKFREMVQRAEGLEEKKQLHESNLAAIKSSMSELKESESELQRRKDGFESHLGDLRRKQGDLNRRIQSRKGELASLERSREKKLSEKGALESEKKNHLRAIEQRQFLVKNISEEMGRHGVDVESLSEEQVEDFRDRVQDEQMRLKSEYDAMLAEHKKSEEDLTNRVNDLRSILRSKETSRTNLYEDIKRHKDKIKGLQSAMDGIPAADTDIEAAKREHTAQESRLKELTEEQNSARFDEKIREKNQEVRDSDDRREELTSELTSLNRQADFRAKLDMNKSAAAKKTADIDALMVRNKDLNVRFTGRQPLPEGYEAAVAEAVSKKEQDLARLQEEDARANKKLQHLESSLSFARSQLKEAETQAQSIESEIQAALAGEFSSLDEALKQCNEEIEYAKNQISLYDSMSSFIKNLSVQVKDKKVCLGCNRGIGHEELGGIEAYISDMKRKAEPATLQGYKDDVESWEEQLAKFSALSPKAARLEALRDEEIPKHESAVEEAQRALRPLGAEVEKTSADVEAGKLEIRELAALRRSSTEVTRMIADRKQAEDNAAAIERDLQSTGSTRTGDEIQREIDDLANKIKLLKRDGATLQQEKDTLRATITSQERNVHRAEIAIAQKTKEHDKLLTERQRLSELNVEQEELTAKLKRLERDIEASQEPVRQLAESLKTVKADAGEKQIGAQTKLGQYNNYTRQLREGSEAVERFIRQRGPQKLKECEGNIESIQNEVQEVRDDISAIEQDVSGIDKDLHESRATERNISDNLRYIQLSRDVKKIDDQLRTINLEDASQANRDYAEKYNVSKRKENDLNGKAAHLNGEIASLRAQVEARERELQEDYKDVHKTFTKKLIEVKTSELAQNDLEIYQKALHGAIMKFHSIKMGEINETLNHLWSTTYQGTDVDTIMIRADSEAAGNRTYNYRVVMVKDSIEMDMRGRCSAGQKCLASILIRLSLAESFSENCGIMALDEPTTNLDEHNIAALGESLGSLISARRLQSNFQLIVITHDTNFLSLLSHSSGGIEKYFRVERDENYRSVILSENRLP